MIRSLAHRIITAIDCSINAMWPMGIHAYIPNDTPADLLAEREAEEEVSEPDPNLGEWLTHDRYFGPRNKTSADRPDCVQDAGAETPVEVGNPPSASTGPTSPQDRPTSELLSYAAELLRTNLDSQDNQDNQDNHERYLDFITELFARADEFRPIEDDYS